MKFDQKGSSYTQNFIKDKMTGRVDVLLRNIEKIAKKLKVKSKVLEITSFLVNYSKNIQILWYFGILGLQF